MIALLSIIAGLIAFVLVPKPTELSRQELLSEVGERRVRKVVVYDNEVITGVSTTRGRFRTPLKPNGAGLIAELRALGVEVVFEKSGLGLI